MSLLFSSGILGVVMVLNTFPKLKGDIGAELETMSKLWEKLRLDGHSLHTWCYGQSLPPLGSG